MGNYPVRKGGLEPPRRLIHRILNGLTRVQVLRTSPNPSAGRASGAGTNPPVRAPRGQSAAEADAVVRALEAAYATWVNLGDPSALRRHLHAILVLLDQ
jgi:hypothetical protein